VSISENDQSYSFDEHLQIDAQSVSPSQDMQLYKQHINALEALIQWQFKKEYEAYKLE